MRNQNPPRFYNAFFIHKVHKFSIIPLFIYCILIFVELIYKESYLAIVAMFHSFVTIVMVAHIKYNNYANINELFFKPMIFPYMSILLIMIYIFFIERQNVLIACIITYILLYLLFTWYSFAILKHMYEYRQYQRLSLLSENYPLILPASVIIEIDAR
jgi:hypothetical protein